MSCARHQESASVLCEVVDALSAYQQYLCVRCIEELRDQGSRVLVLTMDEGRCRGSGSCYGDGCGGGGGCGFFDATGSGFGVPSGVGNAAGVGIGRDGSGNGAGSSAGRGSRYGHNDGCEPELGEEGSDE